MTEIKHTPAPWNINGEFIDGNGVEIAHINPNKNKERMTANKLLIAAAPDLYKSTKAYFDTRDALQKMHDSGECSTEDYNETYKALLFWEGKCEEAINKARGGE